MYNLLGRGAWALAALAVLAMAACTSPAGTGTETPRYSITVEESANGTVSAGAETAAAGEIVALTVSPDEGYELASISTGADIDLEMRGGKYTFAMPEDDVVVTALFVQSGLEKHAITINGMANGSFEAVPEDSQYETLPVRLIARPDPGSKYHPGSLKVSLKGGGEEVKIKQAAGSDFEWVFEMPGEAVEVDADFIDEETVLYDIVISHSPGGTIERVQTSSMAGDTVKLTLAPDEDYRYLAGSLTVTPDVGELNESGGTVTFTMPEEAVHIAAAFEEIPAHAVTVPDLGVHGAISVGSDKIREGRTATATLSIADPESYRYVPGSLRIYMTDGGGEIYFSPSGEDAWEFTMPAGAVTIDAAIEFVQYSPLEIYKGGARAGISVGELSEDKKLYLNSIDMKAEEAGRNGNRQGIKITHALNANGNAVQQSFGLFSAAEISLETASALSFWAKANKQLNLRYVGFGDADPDKRVVYTGEGFSQQIPVTTEWKRYIVPIPSPATEPLGGHKTSRAFLFNAHLAIGNYVYIDDIEFIEGGVTLTDITIPETNVSAFYGKTGAEKLLRGVPLRIGYVHDDGTVATLQTGTTSQALKYNLSHWLAPFIAADDNVYLQNGVLSPKNAGGITEFTVAVHLAGKTSNPMSASIIDGILLDDFEDHSGNIPVTPAVGTGYVWRTNSVSNSSLIITRDYINVVNNEIYTGLAAGNWRPAANANNPRGGRNFEAKDLSAYSTLIFRIRATVGTAASSNYHENLALTFELRNGGLLTNSTGGFFAQPFIYNGGWQEVAIPLSDFAEVGLDTSAVTGYAFSVVDNQGVALRISLDNIAVVP
ncbi:MAG: hypothetical protein LBI06_00745 [Treponema sp.]|jgi:hypothetical protein|nr:hypothetical protein [Treponema sp.]